MKRTPWAVRVACEDRLLKWWTRKFGDAAWGTPLVDLGCDATTTAAASIFPPSHHLVTIPPPNAMPSSRTTSTWYGIYINRA
jgi:hypothetical protein